MNSETLSHYHNEMEVNAYFIHCNNWILCVYDKMREGLIRQLTVIDEDLQKSRILHDVSMDENNTEQASNIEGDIFRRIEVRKTILKELEEVKEKRDRLKGQISEWSEKHDDALAEYKHLKTIEDKNYHTSFTHTL